MNEIRWKQGELDGATTDWIEITAIGRSNDTPIGWTRDREWVIAMPDGVLLRISPRTKGAVATLVVLENDRALLTGMLEEGLAGHGIPPATAKDFPIGVTIETALRVSSYWADLAMRWLETERELGSSLEVLAALRELAIRGEQSHRHRAIRLLAT
jgi:hypothetical protein